MCYFCCIITKFIRDVILYTYSENEKIIILNKIKQYVMNKYRSNIIHIICFIIIILCIKYKKQNIIKNIIISIGNSYVFKPIKVDPQKYEDLLKNPRIIHEKIITTD